MDFDHLPGTTKIRGVSELVYIYNDREAALAEIKKCELVCANCHRIRTYSRQHSGTPKVPTEKILSD
jgi:hypothetical protein